MPREPPVTSAVRPASENMSDAISYSLVVFAPVDLVGSGEAYNKRLNSRPPPLQ
jgi:hypothetical protein